MPHVIGMVDHTTDGLERPGAAGLTVPGGRTGGRRTGQHGHRPILRTPAIAATLSVIVLTALQSATPAAAWSRHGTDMDDEPPGMLRRHAVPNPSPAAEGSWLSGTGRWIGSTASIVAGAAMDTAAAPATAVGGYLSGGSAALGQLGWEVAYMFGVNRTPVAQVHGIDAAIAAIKEAPASEAPERDDGPTPLGKAGAPDTPAEPAAAALPAPTRTPTPTPKDAKLLAALAVDKPQRRSDGSYFVPKPLQRMFDIRTQKADGARMPLTVKLPGRIVPDPNAHGDVEASLLGRIEPPRTGMPVLGETVRKGQILGYVAPAIGVVDRSQVRREVARLTNEIQITAESLEILKQFWFVPFRDGKVIQAGVRLDGLRRERDALLPMLQTQEVLRAAIDGVISASTAINGRIVHPGEKIFEIVNPRLLWIEAVAADPDVARGAQPVQGASAVTPEGDALDLTFIGSGLALQQQSVPLMFRIENPPDGLRVGRPVTVTVRNEARTRDGIPIAREALVTDSGGAEQVWELVAPEVFMPHMVKTETLDGRSVLITAGVDPGARLVTRGARLLSQFQ